MNLCKRAVIALALTTPRFVPSLVCRRDDACDIRQRKLPLTRSEPLRSSLRRYLAPFVAMLLACEPSSPSNNTSPQRFPFARELDVSADGITLRNRSEARLYYVIHPTEWFHHADWVPCVRDTQCPSIPGHDSVFVAFVSLVNPPVQGDSITVVSWRAVADRGAKIDPQSVQYHQFSCPRLCGRR
jgi:hypothetical protein